MTQFTLPDVLKGWPYPRRLSPHYDLVAPESTKWIESFNPFEAKAQKAFNRCDFGKLALLAWPFFDEPRSRAGCDLMNLFFLIDEHTDAGDGHSVKVMADIIKDALKNPSAPRSVDEWAGGEAARQFWELTTEIATTTAQRRFLHTFFQYLDAVVAQAEDRTQKHIRTLDSYLSIRRDTIGCPPSFAIIELEMDLPDDVFYHPTLETLRVCATDMIIIANDIYSYNVEQARGDELHNMVTIVMHHNQLDIRDTMAWIGDLNDRTAKSFLLAKDSLPSWGESIDSLVAQYVRGLGDWVRGNDQWSFEGERYFGTKGMEIIKHRTVTLLPKRIPSNLSSDDQVEALTWARGLTQFRLLFRGLRGKLWHPWYPLLFILTLSIAIRPFLK